VGSSRFSRATLWGRLLRVPLDMLPADAVVPILRGTLAGSRWIVGSATHGSWLGTYESTKQRVFAASIRPGDVVFDLGANVGFYTLIAAQATGARGKVFAFEPLPRNVAFLRSHLHHNRVTNVEVVEAAVAERSGTAAFEEAASPSMGRIGAGGTLPIRTVSLDELLAEGRIVTAQVLKIDIEGGELRALHGARRLLEEHRPVVFLATHGWQVHEDCCAFLTELGYSLSGIGGEAASDTDELVARPG
jgi:FkbM family methyltransferase